MFGYFVFFSMQFKYDSVEYDRVYKKHKKSNTHSGIPNIPHIPVCGINYKAMIDPDNFEHLKRLSLNTKKTIKDIIPDIRRTSGVDIAKKIMEIFMFDGIRMKRDSEDIVLGHRKPDWDESKMNSTNDRFTGVYIHNGHKYFIIGGAVQLVSSQKEKNYIPLSLFDDIKYIKENHQKDTNMMSILTLPIPVSTSVLDMDIRHFINNGIIDDKSTMFLGISSVNYNVLYPSLNKYYPKSFIGLHELDKRSKMYWSFIYMSQMDLDIMIKTVISITSISHGRYLNTPDIEKEIMHPFDDYRKQLTTQDKKLNDYGHNVARFGFFKDIYPHMEFSRVYQKSDSQPYFVHPYSMWLYIFKPQNHYDDDNKYEGHPVTLSYFEQLLQLSRLYTIYDIKAHHFKVQHPRIYNLIKDLYNIIASKKWSLMYRLVVDNIRRHKEFHDDYYKKKIMFILVCLLYKEFHKILFKNDDGVLQPEIFVNYGRVHEYDDMVSYLYNKVKDKYGMSDEEDTLWNEQNEISDVDMDINVFKIIALHGTGVSFGTYDINKNRTNDIVYPMGYQIPIIPIMLPNTYPGDISTLDNYNVYKYMINNLGMTRFPLDEPESVKKPRPNTQITNVWPVIYYPPNTLTMKMYSLNSYNWIMFLGRDMNKPISQNLMYKKISQSTRKSPSGILTDYTINVGRNMLEKVTMYIMYTMPVSRFPYHQVANLLTYKATRNLFNKIHNPKNKWIKKIYDDIYLKLNNTPTNKYYNDIVYTLKTNIISGTVYENMTSRTVYDFLNYVYINVVNPNTYGDWILPKNVIFVEDIKDLTLSYSLNTKHVYVKDIVTVSRYRRGGDLSDYLFRIRMPLSNKRNVFHISDPSQKECLDTYSMKGEKELYTFLIDQQTHVYKSPDRNIQSFFINNKDFNIFSHIRVLEYMTQTSIILIYNRNDIYIFDETNYYINPSYKKIAVVFVTVKARITNKQSYTNIQDKLRNLNSQTNKTWANDEWFIKPSPNKFESNSVIAHIKKYNNDLYKKIMTYKGLYGLNTKINNNDTSTNNMNMKTFLMDIVSMSMNIGYIDNGRYNSLHSIMKVMADTYKRQQSHTTKIKMSYDWSIKKHGNGRILYNLNADVDDTITHLIEDYLKRFKVADDTSKDIGFINIDGYITKWINSGTLYISNGFSTHKSCKRIIRDIYLYRINRPIIAKKNHFFFIINKHFISDIIPMMTDNGIIDIDSQHLGIPMTLTNMSFNTLVRAYQINGITITKDFVNKYHIIPNNI